MSALALWPYALPFQMGLALLAWVISTARRNVGLVDIFWSLFFLLAVGVYLAASEPVGARAILVAAIVSAWSLRLAAHLAARNWNAEEDHRYRAIRERNQPGFELKSLYLVFGLQALLAWLISATLAAGIGSTTALGPLDVVGAVLAMTGIAIEATADAQLARFRADPANAGRVLDRGLWRYSRHPNYFGEFCLWWGLFAIVVSGGGFWTVFSPMLMTLLLLRVSGVALLEKDIGERRPEYRDYVARTSSFIPAPPRRPR